MTETLEVLRADIADLRAKLAASEAREAELRSIVERFDAIFFCPFCWRPLGVNHTEDCRLHAALANPA
jgi:hypothetical protein